MAPAERSLRDGLQRVRRRWFGAVALAVGWKIAIAAAVSLGVVAVVDRMWHPAATLLVALTIAAVVAVAAAALGFAWPYRRRPDDRRVARFVEERYPECEDEIVAAVDVAARAEPTGFAALVVQRASGRLAGLDPARVVSAKELRSEAVRFALATAALTLSVVLTMPSVLRATAGATRPSVRGSSTSPRASSATPPRVESIDLHYDYPPFTGLASRDDRDGGDIYAPAGTRVRMRVRADRPIAAAHVALGSGSVPASRVDARTFESTLTLAADGSYRASVQDAGGLRGESVEYFIRLVTDRPPEIHIVRPAGDQEITPLEEVTIEAQADDDFGIASMDMVFAVAGGPEHVVAFQSTSGPATARTGRRLLSAEELGVKPGDVISYYARARDVPHAKLPTLAHSEIYFLEVKPFNEEYSLAESQAMAASAGTELAGLIAAQKEVISATWNLQRRAKAGASSDDLKAVATAQADVKARTERAAGARPFRRGAGGMFLQFIRVPQEAGGLGHVAEAAAAMARAVEQLNGGSTKDAISPEMTALTALLKAEAEIRQRQITQQRNGSASFGNGRQGQDLSSLFDRELKRQQKSSYETRSAAEAQQPRPDTQPALDRISDLARRQEDLARRQQASSTLPDEERRRELERLTREQQELQRQLEQAAEQQQRSASAGGSNAQKGSSAQQAIREALQQMRAAARELQRQNARDAASKAAAAAGQLRRAEAGLQNSRPAAADATSETRGLADALDSLRKTRDDLTRLQRRLEKASREDRERGQQGARAGSELERAQQDYTRALQRAQEMVRGTPQPGKNTGLAASTPEQHEWSWGAPGTEAWKQDFSKWEALGNNLGRALERSESSVADRLSKSLARDRLRGGAAERVPDGYAERVARYYESLASAVKRQ